MVSLFTPESRAERLIAAVRIVLAASSLFAVWLDPTEPAKFASVAYALLAAYLVYSLAVALWVTQSPALPGAQRWLSHGFDLAFFSLFTYFTSGPSSPFIAYFVFSLVCATLRWQWRGTFWTAVVALATFLSLAIYFAEVLEDPGFELMPFVIRGVYLVVFAILLGYLGFHEERTRREMSMLAAWPSSTARTAPELARELLATGASLLKAERAVAAWVDHEEPWLYIASWSATDFTLSQEPAAEFEPLVAPPLTGSSFLCPDLRSEPVAVLFRSMGRTRRWSGIPVERTLRGRLGTGPLLAAPLAGELHQGWLFFLGQRDLTSDDLVLGEIISGVIAGKLDHVYLIEELREAAAAQERVRLARDLHDGVLQSFTGIGLHVAAARRLVESASEPVAKRLGELQKLLAGEQRDLRLLIQELESPDLAGAAEPENLAARLSELAQQIRQTWGLEMVLRLDELPAAPSVASGREVYKLVREAVINAARHGAATRVEVDLRRAAGGQLAITVADDGHGFPFHGHFGFAELEAKEMGPRTLRARLASMGGEISIESGGHGSRIEMLVPREVAPV